MVPSRSVQAGDVIVFPEGDPHVICSDPNVARGAVLDARRIEPAEQWPYAVERADREHTPGHHCLLVKLPQNGAPVSAARSHPPA
jgi:hypothetical protein